MKITNIKINKKTLPKDKQKVEWQTYQDINNNSWKQGVFVSGDNLFCIGFGDSHSKWDSSFDVFHWRKLKHK